MDIIESNEGNVTILTLAGRLDLYNGPTLKERAASLIEAGKTQLLLVLAEVTLIDSSGMGTLLGIRSDIRAVGGTVALAEPTELTASILHNHLGEFIPIYDDEEEALAMFPG